MYCKSCGKELPDESLYCGYCGAQLQEKTEPISITPQKEIKESKIHISADDFTPLIDVIRNPFEETGLGVYASAAVAVIGLIAGWLQFGFGYALLILAVFWAGTAGILWLGDRKDGIAGLVSETAQLLTVPSLMMLASGFFGLVGLNAFIVMFRLFLMALAVTVYILSLNKRVEAMNRWLLAALCAVMIAVAASCAVSALASLMIIY